MTPAIFTSQPVFNLFSSLQLFHRRLQLITLGWFLIWMTVASERSLLPAHENAKESIFTKIWTRRWIQMNRSVCQPSLSARKICQPGKTVNKTTLEGYLQAMALDWDESSEALDPQHKRLNKLNHTLNSWEPLLQLCLGMMSPYGFSVLLILIWITKKNFLRRKMFQHVSHLHLEQ